MDPTPITSDHFRHLIAQVTSRIDGRPLNADLQVWLNEALGPQSGLYQEIKAACEAGASAGWLCERQAPDGTRFGRVFEPADDLHGYSVDVVEMTDVVAPHHVHPTGEIDLVMPQQGDARFEGHGAGWVVYGPGSAHSPAVRGGRAYVLYLLPNGEIDFTQ